MATGQELRELNEEELQRRIAELRQAKFDKRLQHRIGELANSAELRATRRDIARLLTVLRAKQLAAVVAKAPAKATRAGKAAKQAKKA
jgi:large subunit ribosomal protein L29